MFEFFYNKMLEENFIPNPNPICSHHLHSYLPSPKIPLSYWIMAITSQLFFLLLLCPSVYSEQKRQRDLVQKPPEATTQVKALRGSPLHQKYTTESFQRPPRFCMTWTPVSSLTLPLVGSRAATLTSLLFLRYSRACS